MTDIQVLKSFASEVIELANGAKQMAKIASEKASASEKEQKTEKKKAELNSEKLAKAASAVAALYGDRASVNADSLMRIWDSNHNNLVDSLLKVASDRIAEKVKEPEMIVVKKASVETKPKVPRNAAHREAFDQIFGIGK